jgi:hypothetical protein
MVNGNGGWNRCIDNYHKYGQIIKMMNEFLSQVNLRWNKLRTIPGELFDLAIRANAPFGRIWIASNYSNWLENGPV